ncbi:MAG: sodium-dependent transporter [Candidatus Omnitrophica bacterium]|nr:sodium-dependent transporter [Candidatus Omnitrophota bacterium]MDD5737402.1 sodium-dependent transporter [Candidatus Omnitrophota bacterium]
MAQKSRQTWGTKLGIIMAVAGSAVGLGNFLRFPVQAAQNGGGAFMIPYFVALLLLGIPLMWIEWSLGRYGGGFGHGTAPGIFHSLRRKNRFIKYFGVIGIFGPLVILIYYTYIESWTLAYSFFSLTGKYAGATTQAQLQSFLSAFQGLEANQYFDSLQTAYVFFLITFALNIFVLYHGIKGGIERLCNIAMPALMIFGILIAARVLTLGTPDILKPDWNALNGLGFLWNPDFAMLKDPKVWLAAAGQVFFTLSVGIGVILTYASYLKKTDDVALSGLTAAGMNEFAEVILGGSIVITAAFVFFGPVGAQEVAKSGSFNLGFVTMPAIFSKIPLTAVFGFLWFMMLFLAGVTSSVSLAQPAVAFLEDEFNLNRKKALGILTVVFFVLCQPAIFFLGKGVVDEMDFWGGTFCLVLFATIETILFTWVFGMDKAWEEMHHGAELRIPGAYKFIMRYITPLFLLVILGSYVLSDSGRQRILMANVAEADKPYILGTRLMLLGIIAVIALMVRNAWKKKGGAG